VGEANVCAFLGCASCFPAPRVAGAKWVWREGLSPHAGMVSELTMNEKVILLVEDNPDDAALMLRALKKQNIPNEVVLAADGVEALDYLFGTGSHEGRDAGMPPGLVLLDLKLPKVDGLEVLRRMRADPRTRFVPVVILTSSREEQDVLNGYTAGANSYIRKPVDFTEFTDVVRNLGFYWLALNEAPPPGGASR
jgi:two-component system, response regulator